MAKPSAPIAPESLSKDALRTLVNDPRSKNIIRRQGTGLLLRAASVDAPEVFTKLLGMGCSVRGDLSSADGADRYSTSQSMIGALVSRNPAVISWILQNDPEIMKYLVLRLISNSEASRSRVDWAHIARSTRFTPIQAAEMADVFLSGPHATQQYAPDLIKRANGAVHFRNRQFDLPSVLFAGDWKIAQAINKLPHDLLTTADPSPLVACGFLFSATAVINQVEMNTGAVPEVHTKKQATWNELLTAMQKDNDHATAQDWIDAFDTLLKAGWNLRYIDRNKECALHFAANLAASHLSNRYLRGSDPAAMTVALHIAQKAWDNQPILAEMANKAGESITKNTWTGARKALADQVAAWHQKHVMESVLKVHRTEITKKKRRAGEPEVAPPRRRM